MSEEHLDRLEDYLTVAVARMLAAHRLAEDMILGRGIDQWVPAGFKGIEPATAAAGVQWYGNDWPVSRYLGRTGAPLGADLEKARSSACHEADSCTLDEACPFAAACARAEDQ